MRKMTEEEVVVLAKEEAVHPMMTADGMIEVEQRQMHERSHVHVWMVARVLDSPRYVVWPMLVVVGVVVVEPVVIGA